MSVYKNIIGKRIKSLRDKVSQDSLCDSIGKKTGKRPKRSTLSSWEQGKTSPSLDQLEALADIFSVDVSYLLGDCDTYRIDNQSVFEEYGLSENALDTLKLMNSCGYEDFLAFISKLIENERYISDPLRIHWWANHPKEYFHDYKLPCGVLSQLFELCEMDFNDAMGVVEGTVTVEGSSDVAACFNIRDVFTGYFMAMCNDLRNFISFWRKDKGLKDYE